MLGVERKLAAILAADVVGYSRVMQAAPVIMGTIIRLVLLATHHHIVAPDRS
jgi:hypothetical protein